MNPLIQTAMKIGFNTAAKISPQRAQALLSRRDILGRLERAQKSGAGKNVISSLDKAFKLISKETQKLK